MKQKNKLIKLFSIIALSLFATSSCDDSSKTGDSSNNLLDSNSNLIGSWKFEESGVTANLEINNDHTFKWVSDDNGSIIGGFEGKWTRSGEYLTIEPSDDLNPRQVLKITNNGQLIEQSNDGNGFIYDKIE